MSLSLPNFISRILHEPDLAFHEFPSLWSATINTGSPDLSKVRRLLTRAHQDYESFNHIPCIAKCYAALLELLKAKSSSATLDASNKVHFELLSDTLGLFARAAVWYGYRGPLSSLNALKDSEIITRILNNNEKKSETLMRLSSEYYKRAKYLRAQTYLEEAASLTKAGKTRSDILAVSGYIALRTGALREAIAYYRTSVQLDESVGSPGSSFGDHLSALGFAEIKMGIPEGRSKIEEGLKLSEEAGNPGFLFKLYKACHKFYMERGDYDAARSYVQRALELLETHFHSYKSQSISLRKIVEQQFPELEVKMPRRLSVTDIALEQVFDHVEDSINKNELFAAAVGLNFSIERMIKLAGPRIGSADTGFEAMTLSKRNCLLLKSGVYDEDVFWKIDSVRRELRNAISHADLESDKIKKYLSREDLRNLFEWCSWFAREFL